MLWLIIREEVPANQRDMVTLLLGTLAGMASSVVAYWVGSSNGSMQKSAALEKALGKKAEMEMLPLQPGDIPDTYADVGDLVEQFRYKPATPVVQGVESFVDWYRYYY